MNSIGGLFDSKSRFLSSLQSSRSTNNNNIQSDPIKKQQSENLHNKPEQQQQFLQKQYSYNLDNNNNNIYHNQNNNNINESNQKHTIQSQKSLDFFQPVFQQTESIQYADKYRHILNNNNKMEEEEEDDHYNQNQFQTNPFPKPNIFSQQNQSKQKQQQYQKEEGDFNNEDLQDIKFYSQQPNNNNKNKRKRNKKDYLTPKQKAEIKQQLLEYKLQQQQQNQQQQQYQWVEIEIDEEKIKQKQQQQQQNDLKILPDIVQQQRNEAKRQLQLLEENDFFKQLGLQCDATQDQVKKSYKKLCIQYHPDKQHGKSQQELEQCQSQFQIIKRAYNILSNPQTRKIYENEGYEAVQFYEDCNYEVEMEI